MGRAGAHSHHRIRVKKLESSLCTSAKIISRDKYKAGKLQVSALAQQGCTSHKPQHQTGSDIHLGNCTSPATIL